MSEPLKYKVGDKFIIEVESCDCFNEDYIVAETLRIPQWGLDRLERYDEAKIVRKAIQRRIDELTAMVVAFEKERDVLCEYMNREDGDGRGKKGL